MRYITFISMRFIIITLLAVPFVVSAQQSNPVEVVPSHIQVPNAGLSADLPARDAQAGSLPRAGITPESPFYFLDKAGEVIQEFFTFNPETKTMLQLTFVLERIAEIQVILETSGIEAKGLAIARERLKEHASKAVDIVENEKLSGKDVSPIAGEVMDTINLQKKTVEQIFEKAQEKFLAEKEYLRGEFLTAIKAKDIEAQKKVRRELVEVKAIKNKMGEKRDATLLALETEKDRLLDDVSDEKRREEKVRELDLIAQKQKEAEEERIRIAIRQAGPEQYENQLKKQTPERTIGNEEDNRERSNKRAKRGSGTTHRELQYRREKACS